MAYSMEELLPVVGRLAEKYTAYESTSVTYETAERLMGVVLYCIREGELEDRYLPASGEHLPAQQAYERGRKAVEQKTRDALAWYHKILPDFLSYGNVFLHDTVLKELPEFFRWYDIQFYPQDTILTLDYPVKKDLSAYCGIDKIYEYIQCIFQEQQYLSHFPEQYIIETLKQWNPSYMDMPVNLEEIVRASVQTASNFRNCSLDKADIF